jgi:FMN phosphatase YigB (HAD superfamily)
MAGHRCAHLRDSTSSCFVLRTVLIDVGGTLWPDVWPGRPDDDSERVARLCHAAPSVGESDALALVRSLATPHPTTQRQETASMIASALRGLDLRVDLPASVVAAAMCLPPRGRVTLFPGAEDLLRGLAQRDRRVVIVSNVVWRDAASYRRAFEELGVAQYVSAYVTSLDVGWRKPHHAFFDAALAVSGVSPRECAMVGDDEVNDIVPAHARGMVTLRIAIEQPLPDESVADHICGSLSEVRRLLDAS